MAFLRTPLGTGICLTALGAVITLAAIACEDAEPHRRTTGQQAQPVGGACEAKPGSLPQPNCDNSDKKCDPQVGCSIDVSKCGSVTTCLPMSDNKGKDVLDFRMRRLNIAAPAQLASDFIQNTVVTLNIDLEAKECGELGKGLFSWLLRIDKKAGTLTTGGSPPSKDPFGQGFCFANFTIGANKVEPIVTKIVFEGDTFKALDHLDINIPIFIADDNAIVLPISKAHIEGVTVSDDGNCIGRLNKDALDPGCYDDRALCQKWQTAGAIGGYITLEKADTVKIRDLNNKSLCSFLASEAGAECARDGSGKIQYKGDYCSTTDSPGGCADSVWLAATFAASAAKIFDGKGIVQSCSGVTQDAGVDAAQDASDASKD